MADMIGNYAPHPVEPGCTGYAARLDEAFELISQDFNLSMAAISAREEARCERLYASSRKYQTRYLAFRLWGFLAGTTVKLKQAQMARNLEKATLLSDCLRKARDDAPRKQCQQWYGESLKSADEHTGTSSGEKGSSHEKESKPQEQPRAAAITTLKRNQSAAEKKAQQMTREYCKQHTEDEYCQN